MGTKKANKDTASDTSIKVFRCAIYARVSTEKDEQKDSPEHQIALGREIARRRSMDAADDRWLTPDELIYLDKSSGREMAQRADMLKLLKDAADGKFDIVIFKSISRFARDTEDSLHMLRRLKAAKVRVISFIENFDSDRDNEFIFTIHAGLAQQGSEKISVDVLLGNMAKAAKGQWNGKAPDGYEIGEDKRLVKNKRNPIMKYIFDLFTSERLGSTSIVKRVNAEGYRTRTGKRFRRKTIYNILTNPAYAGDVYYGRRTQETYYDEYNRRRKRTVMDEEERNLVVCEDAHEATVSREQFNLAQDLLEANKTGKRDKGDWVYLFSGMIKCGCCGSPFHGKVNHVGTRYYRCIAKVAYGSDGCDNQGIRALDYEKAVVDRIREWVSGIDFNAIERPKADLRHHDLTAIDELATVDADIEKLTAKAIGLLEKNMDGVISDEMFARMNAQVEEQIRDAETRRRSLTERLENMEQAELSLRNVEEAITEFLALEIHEQPNRALGRELLRRIVECIEIGKDGTVDIQYKFEKVRIAKHEVA